MGTRLEWTAIVISIVAAVAGVGSVYATWALGKDTLRSTDVDQRRQERAYLGVEQFQVTRYLPGKPWRLNFTIENYGQTPALQVRNAFDTGVYEMPMPQHRLDQLFAALSNRPGITSVNRQQTKLVMGRARDWADTREIAKGTKALIFFGRLQYVDVFGDRHVARYCIVVRELIGGELTQGLCRFGNDTG